MKKLSLNKIQVSSFITEAQSNLIKGGESICNACLNVTQNATDCLGSLYPTRCCIPEYPTHPCTNGTVCDPTATTTAIAVTSIEGAC